MNPTIDPPATERSEGDSPTKRVVPRRPPAPSSTAGSTGGPSAGSSAGTGSGGADRGDRAARSARLAWTIAAIGIIGTIGFGIAWAGARGDDGGGGTAQTGSNAALLSSAKSFAKALTNFDGATVDRDFDRITAKATGEFASQADQFFSSEVRTQLKKAQASSRGEVRSAFVQTASAERGTVFVVVDQTIANNLSPQPQADTLRMELGLVFKDGQWLVERVNVLTAPAGGSTPATGSKSTTTTTKQGG